MDQKLLELKASVLLNKFGAGSHKPGSGSAAALLGMLAIQLLQTVISLTIDPKRRSIYEQHQSRFLEIQSHLLDRILPDLEKLFQEDSEQFDIVINHRKKRELTSNALLKKQCSNAALEALILATNYPIQIAKNCLEVADFSLDVFDNGFQSARGDSGVALNTAISAIAGCLSIVELNLLSFDANEWTIQIRSQQDFLNHNLSRLKDEANQRLLNQRALSERYQNLSRSLQDIKNRVKGKKYFSESEIEKVAISLQKTLWIYRDLIWNNRSIKSPFEILSPDRALRSYGFLLDKSTTLGTFFQRGIMYEIAGQIDQKNRIVSLSKQFPNEIQNFTSAHELGHSLLHTQEVLHRDRPLDGSGTRSKPAPEEWQADKFASYFLMPEKLVRKTFHQIFFTDSLQVNQETAFALNEGSIDRLIEKSRNLRGFSRLIAEANFYNSKSVIPMAQRFNVSLEAMAIRLEELNLVEFPV